MLKHTENLIIGQGLAGSAMAWTVHWAGKNLLLVDRGEPNTASRVAAGLITPVTGKRMVHSPDFDQYWNAAKQFYRRVEQETGTSLFEEKEMIRLFEDEASRTEFTERSDEYSQHATQPWEGTLQRAGRLQIGISMRPAGRLNVKAYLTATRTFFEERNSYVASEIDVTSDLLVKDQVEWSGKKVTADRLILCQGSEQNQFFPGVPNNRSRGDILKVKIEGYERSEVVHRSIWIAPESNGVQTVGSTYDWKNISSNISDAGRKEVLKKLSRLIDGQVVVLDHEAGVRPTMKDYEPVLGRHPEYRSVYLFNGLGSKGTLKSPWLASQMMLFIAGETTLSVNHSYERLIPAKSQHWPLTRQAQEAVAEVLRSGDTAIDGTVGNGFDTIFLAKAVGITGHVIGFDVQTKALQSTENRLAALDCKNVSLRHQSHVDMGTVAEPGSVAAIMFNLGYLPGSDHQLMTNGDSSTKAVSEAIKLLRSDGILTVLAYRGHEGGQEEYAAVEQLLTSFADRYDYNLQRIERTPPKQTAPVLFVLRKTLARETDDD